MKGICEKKINPRITILIYNILRNLGLYSNTKGTAIINKAIQIVLLNDNEFFSIDEIYNTLTNYYQNMSVMQIRDSIRYALKHRNEIKCENNFETIFGFEYDEDFFTNKKIIEEIANLIKLESI